MHGEWDIACRLETPLGTLNFNAATGHRYLLDKDVCKVSHGLRVTSDMIPEGDGEIFHRRFANGTELQLKVTLWDDNGPACDQTLREMVEELSGHVASILNGDGRFFYQPTGYTDERMVDQLRWLTPFGEEHDAADLVSLTFGLDSPFPYVLDKTEITVPVAEGVIETVTNYGNTPYYAVMQVQGLPTSSFTITNQTTGLSIVYDSFRPGGWSIASGDYAEITTFQSKIYLNGDEDVLAAGIDPLNSDFFTLLPGANDILILGADMDILVNNAWVPV